MTQKPERTIEAALERYFSDQGWSLDVNGDHFATMFTESEMGPCGYEVITINLTECAKAIAEELALHAA